MSDVVERARTRPYALGEHDCFRVACAAVKALIGVDRWPEWTGRYRTKREALRLLAEYGSSFQAAGDKFFGVHHSDVKLARRGDILAYTYGGEKHLGVCLGAKAALTSQDGLLFMPTLEADCCWRIG